jgi:hypothetical protein
MSLLDNIWQKLVPGTAPVAGNRSHITGDVTDSVARETSCETLPRIMPTPAHAQRLLTVLIQSGYEGKELLVADLQRLYAELCGQLNWRARPWNPLAKQFRLLTTGSHKPYRWFDFTDGIRRRVRVFPIIRNPQLQASGPVVHTQPMEPSEARRAVA